MNSCQGEDKNAINEEVSYPDLVKFIIYYNYYNYFESRGMVSHVRPNGTMMSLGSQFYDCSVLKQNYFSKKKWFFFIFQNKAGNIRQSYPVRKKKSCPCKIRYDDLNSTWFKLGMTKRRERVRYRLPSPPTSKERQGHPWSHQEGDLLNLKASVHRTYDILENSNVRGRVQILNDKASPPRNQKDPTLVIPWK